MPERHRYEVIIVGGGVAGLGLSVRLRRADLGDHIILEKAGSLGGTWRDNTYPGCACDIPSHLYSFSYPSARNPSWSRRYPGQAEIEQYLQNVADHHGVTRRIRFGVEVTCARYDDESREWTVTTRLGDTYTGRVLVLATGPLHHPATPDIPGLGDFTGPVWHSARWDHDVDPAGQRIGVIGTGASAVQFVPQLAGRAAHLTVFQRTPGWVLPRRDRPYPAWLRRVLASLPGAARAYRAGLYWRHEARALGFTVSPALLRLAQRFALRHLHTQVADPALRAALTPDHTLGCKRVLLSDDWYPTLTRPDVTLVTAPISRVEPDAVRTTDGGRHPVDMIVLGTGFQVTGAQPAFPVFGSGGRGLVEEWRGGVNAYLGMLVAGFPNLFLMTGPNTGLGHNSVVFMIEAQARYIEAAVQLLHHGAEDATLAVRPVAQRRFNDRVQRRMRRTVWLTGGCRSWYLDADGVNRTLWPGFTFSYWWQTRRLRHADLTGAPEPAADLTGDR